jgi:very-short-patch-repair endonuclease
VFSSLVPLLVVIAIAVVVIAVLGALRRGSSEAKENGSLTLELRKKRYFFSQAERAFYIALTNATKDMPVTVMSKVRLNDLVEPFGDNRQATNNRINRMHVDFVLLSQPDFQPILGIELDGSSHQRQAQQTRDAKKDAAFRASGLPLLRFPNGVEFRQLQTALEPHLNGLVSAPTATTPTKARVRSVES